MHVSRFPFMHDTSSARSASRCLRLYACISGAGTASSHSHSHCTKVLTPSSIIIHCVDIILPQAPHNIICNSRNVNNFIRIALPPPLSILPNYVGCVSSVVVVSKSYAIWIGHNVSVIFGWGLNARTYERQIFY